MYKQSRIKQSKILIGLALAFLFALPVYCVIDFHVVSTCQTDKMAAALEAEGYTVQPLPTNTFALAKHVDFVKFTELAEQWNSTVIYQQGSTFYVVKTVFTQDPDFEVTIGYYITP